MKLHIPCLFVASLFVALASSSQNAIDVLHYEFHIELSDPSDTIKGRARITLSGPAVGDMISFDLTGSTKDGKGMVVTAVWYNDNPIPATQFRQANNKVLVFPSSMKPGDTAVVTIAYKGIPTDGLIISRNKFGERSFFSDNWPNRAHHWIPCHDDPSDKASVDFLVTAPAHYQVISNGVQVEESSLTENRKLTHWQETVPLPTKVMVIGAADFAVNYIGDVNCVPVSSWVFAANKQDGFYDYAPAKEILAFMMDYIGPYPFRKLANVQSKTIFGGMENASAIFYFENSVTGKRSDESLFAHEIAHQWFGDMATERSFPHLWLSEGFATYLTHIYIESRYGTDSMAREMQKDRQDVIEFSKKSTHPIVDTVSALMDLLNTNSYQKGSWVLHMLRRELGDSTFHLIIRNYYNRFKGSNATTEDFQAIAEEICGRSLERFFRQWLYTPGIPHLRIGWRWMAKDKFLQLTVPAGGSWSFPLEFEVELPSGQKIKKTLTIDSKAKTLSWDFADHPKRLLADPHTSLLADIIVEELK